MGSWGLRLVLPLMAEKTSRVAIASSFVGGMCHRRHVPPSPKIQPFPAGTVEGVAKVLGELYSGSEVTRVLAEVPLRDDPGEGITKWRRIAHALSANQAKTATGNALVGLVARAMNPHRTLDRKARADGARDELNQILSLSGLQVLDDGRVARTKQARTDTEALSRSSRLQTVLTQRGAHAQVLAYCRPELLRVDYYEAVFEAIKGLSSRLREMTGIDADGHKLVDGALLGPSPQVRLNPGATESQRNEQTGVANLAKGLFSAFRNPAAHEPRLRWTMSEQDAMDVLSTLSLIHRRLDAAITDVQHR